jgi:hypothetical protein
MVWYKGVRADDPKPIGGGAYNEMGIGGEVYNFLPAGHRYLGYFQPQKQPRERLKANPSTIHLEKIQPGFVGDKLEHVLVVFVARNPDEGGQYIVGWYRDATVYRYKQTTSSTVRRKIAYFLETSAVPDHGMLLPKSRRLFPIPGAVKGGFGKANICYTHDDHGYPKENSPWIADALEYVNSYKHENAASSPETATDQIIADVIEASIENGAGCQSNPVIRRAVEEYAMQWAEKRLRQMGLKPKDKHKSESYDFLCSSGGKDLFVEVKGTQSDGRCISLTPNEVAHAKRYENSTLFIVYDVKVDDKRPPKVTGGKELVLMPWDIHAGKLEPRGYAFTVPKGAFFATGGCTVE